VRQLEIVTAQATAVKTARAKRNSPGATVRLTGSQFQTTATSAIVHFGVIIVYEFRTIIL